MNIETVVDVVDQALMAKDQLAFDRLVIGMVFSGVDADELGAVMIERLEAMPHEVQVYWKGDCNCDGHLN